MRRTVLLIAATALSAFAACGDDSNGTTTHPGLDASFADVPQSDTFVGSGDTSPNPDAVRRLAFEQDFGDDQVACRGTDRCMISLSYTERRTLKVLYTEDGVPTAGRVVKFALEGDDDGVGFLNTLSSVTGATGVGQVETRAKEARIGQFVVKAWIDDATGVDPLFFDVVVTPKGQVPLTVIGNYTGSRPVGSYNVRLYKQDASNKPDCSDLLDLYDQHTADRARDNILVTQSAKFPDLDGLEIDGTQTYTVFVFSGNASGAIQAWGCNDTDAVLEWGSAKTVQVELIDRPPIYTGDYDITSRFDFVSAIPEPYRTWVNYIVSFFQSPTHTVLALACDLLADDECAPLNGFCNLFFDLQTNDNGTCDLVPGTLGGFASDLLDSIIDSVAEDSVFGTIFQVGGDVADMLKEFEIKGVLSFNAEPDANGEWTEGQTKNTWHTAVWKWSLGANCDPETDEHCGTSQFNLGTRFTEGDAVSGTFAASVADYYDLTIGVHPLDFKYGAFINFFVEEYFLGLLTGAPQVKSYEDLLGFLVGGGVECLTPSDENPTCCELLAENVGQDFVTSICESVLQTGSEFLRNQLTGLEAGTGDTFTIGTLEPCTLSDFNSDMIIDGVGSKASPCKWDVKLNVGNGATFDAIFWGARQE